MDERSPTSEAPGGTGAMGRGSPPGTPRWVKAFGVIAVVVLVLFVILLLTGSDHGPGRHLDGGEGPPPGVEHSTSHP